MEVYLKRICLEYSDLVDEIMSDGNFRKLSQGSKIEVLRRGCRNTPALVAWDSLPTRFKMKWIAVHGDPEQQLAAGLTRAKMEYKESAAARAYYSNYIQNNAHLSEDEIERCVANASVLEQIDAIIKRRKAERKMRNNPVGDVWSTIEGEYNMLRNITGHTLPASLASLRNKLTEYKRKGYNSLINKRYGNSNAGKITAAGGRYLVAMKRSVQPRYNTADMLVEYNKMAQKKGWKLLQSENSITTYLSKPAVQQLWYSAVYGEHATKQLFDRKMQTALPTLRNALWYGDGTKLNLYYREYIEGKGWTLKTTQVYEVIDAASERFLGYCISDNEDSKTQYKAFRMAIETANEKPFEVVVDNQSSWRKLESFYRRICRVFHNTKPRNPQSKTIEQVFGRFQAQILSKNLGFTGANITAKSGGKLNLDLIEANIDKLPTYSELCTLYAEQRRLWNTSLHPSFDESREAVYERAANPECPTLTPELRVAMLWEEREREVQFSASGIKMQVEGKAYTYEPVTADGAPDYAFRNRYTLDRFVVKYDPFDLTRIKLYQRNSVDELVYVADALPYTVVHRAIQDQQAGERVGIIAELERTDLNRMHRELRATQIEQEWGMDLESKGLNRPRLGGISAGKAERLLRKNLADKTNKELSNITIDQLRMPSVDAAKLAEKL